MSTNILAWSHWLLVPWEVIIALNIFPTIVKYFPYFRTSGKQDVYKLSNLKLAMTSEAFYSLFTHIWQNKVHFPDKLVLCEATGCCTEATQCISGGPKWQTGFAFSSPQFSWHNDKTLFFSINIPSWHCLPVFEGHKAVLCQPDTFPLPHISSSSLGKFMSACGICPLSSFCEYQAAAYVTFRNVFWP